MLPWRVEVQSRAKGCDWMDRRIISLHVRAHTLLETALMGGEVLGGNEHLECWEEACSERGSDRLSIGREQNWRRKCERAPKVNPSVFSLPGYQRLLSLDYFLLVVSGLAPSYLTSSF
jgi:hypothetical protein